MRVPRLVGLAESDAEAVGEGEGVVSLVEEEGADVPFSVALGVADGGSAALVESSPHATRSGRSSVAAQSRIVMSAVCPGISLVGHWACLAVC